MNPLRRLALATALLLALDGCNVGAQGTQVQDGTALAQIRALVEGQRQCAPLLSGSWPIEFSADALAGDRVDALVDAGLVRREPVTGTADDRPRERIVVAPGGAHDVWIRRLDPASPPEPMLCYGRKHVVAVRVEPQAAAEAGGPARDTTLRYDYRVANPPAWTARADIRAAFPFIAEELGRLHTAQQRAIRLRERWTLNGDTDPNASAELPPETGFFPG